MNDLSAQIGENLPDCSMQSLQEKIMESYDRPCLLKLFTFSLLFVQKLFCRCKQMFARANMAVPILFPPRKRPRDNFLKKIRLAITLVRKANFFRFVGPGSPIFFVLWGPDRQFFFVLWGSAKTTLQIFLEGPRSK